MKLQDFLIGLGLFGLFTIIIFGAINPNDTNSPYNEKYLNVTHDSNTSKAITNISNVGTTTTSDFSDISGGMKNFSSGNPAPDETNLVGSALKTLINLPQSWKPVANVLRVMEVVFGIPPAFTSWLIGSIVIIIILILIASFLKNKLES